MKLNKKGFTVVELLASFTLTMLIVVFLFEIVLQLKDVYVDNSLRVKIVEKNAVVATNLNKMFSSDEIESVICTSYCDIHFRNGTVKFLKISYVDNKRTTDQVILGTYPSDPLGFASEDDVLTAQENNIDLKIVMPEGTRVLSQEISQYGDIFDDSDSLKDNNYISVSYINRNDKMNNDVTFNYVYTYHQS